jgi:hypothetical protein
MRRWRALAIVPLAVMMLTGPVLAQEEGEDEEAQSIRLVGVEECVTDPLAPEAISNMLALDGEGVPPPATITITPPLGEIADPVTDIEIKEAARTILACFNAGDIPRAASLMTENGVRRAYWGLTIDQASREATAARLTAEPEPRQPERFVRLISVTDSSVLPDGRVAAFVIINEPLLPPAGPETLLFIFANQDGRWLLDDLIDFSIVPADFGAEATPTS